MPMTEKAVIPAQAGIQVVTLTTLNNNLMNFLDPGLRRDDGHFGNRLGKFHSL